MKLFLWSHDPQLLEQWREALSHYTPLSISALSARMIDSDDKHLLIVSRQIFDTKECQDLVKLHPFSMLVLTLTPQFEEAQLLLSHGISGYGHALMHPTHLQSAVQAIMEGSVWLHPDFISRLMFSIKNADHATQSGLSYLDKLTPREKEVALLLANGATHHDIADSLAITVRTVKAHSTSIYEKLEVKDRLALSLLIHS